MTLQEIEKRIDEIKNNKGDEERQHSKEDYLYEDFVRFVSSGECQDFVELQEKAKKILETKLLDFPRWCA